MSTRVQRYTESERMVHWTVALLFILAALSGLAFFHPALFWLSALFGGGTWTRILHPFIGVLMVVVFCWTMAHFWFAMRLDANDRRWLRQWRDVVAARDERLPAVGRFNAGQKLVFWVAVVCALTLLATGIVFWQPYFAGLFPIWLVRAATLLHSVAAVVFVLTILVHIYAAIWTRGSVRAMLRGDVSDAWAKKHHPAWDRRLSG